VEKEKEVDKEKAEKEKEKKKGKEKAKMKLHSVNNYWWYRRMGKSVINNHGYFSPGILVRDSGASLENDEDILII